MEFPIIFGCVATPVRPQAGFHCSLILQDGFQDCEILLSAYFFSLIFAEIAFACCFSDSRSFLL